MRIFHSYCFSKLSMVHISFIFTRVCTDVCALHNLIHFIIENIFYYKWVGGLGWGGWSGRFPELFVGWVGWHTSGTYVYVYLLGIFSSTTLGCVCWPWHAAFIVPSLVAGHWFAALVFPEIQTPIHNTNFCPAHSPLTIFYIFLFLFF